MLQELDLSDNALSALPPEIWNLTTLQLLYLSNNQLSELPPEIGNLALLQRLSLSGNQLSELPPEIGHLTALRGLYLYDNPLPYPPDLINNNDDGAALIAWLQHPTPYPPYRVRWTVPFVLLLLSTLLLLIGRAGVRRLHRWG